MKPRTGPTPTRQPTHNPGTITQMTGTMPTGISDSRRSVGFPPPSLPPSLPSSHPGRRSLSMTCLNIPAALRLCFVLRSDIFLHLPLPNEQRDSAEVSWRRVRGERWPPPSLVKCGGLSPRMPNECHSISIMYFHFIRSPPLATKKRVRLPLFPPAAAALFPWLTVLRDATQRSATNSSSSSSSSSFSSSPGLEMWAAQHEPQIIS